MFSVYAYAPFERSVASNRDNLYKELTKNLCTNGDFNATANISKRHCPFDDKKTSPSEAEDSSNNGGIPS